MEYKYKRSSKKLIERNKNNILLDPKFFFIKELKGHTNDVTTLAYIKERDLLVSASSDNTLRVWSMKIYQLISVIKDLTQVKSYEGIKMSMIDNYRCIISGQYSLTIIDINSG